MRYRSALYPVLLIAGLLLISACDNEDEDDFPAVYEVEVAGQERFRIALETPAQIAAAEQRLAGGEEGVVYGVPVRGDGGFNAPYHWHLKPETVDFPDVTIEACSGRPRSDVEADLDYWIDTLGAYCPWGSRIVRRVK